MTEKIITALAEAQNVLSERGWAKHKLQTPAGEVCLAGAIAHAIGVTSDDDMDITDEAFQNKLDDHSLFKQCQHELERTLERDDEFFENRNFKWGWSVADFNDNIAKDVSEVAQIVEDTNTRLKANSKQMHLGFS